jgi:hypothetical protein
MTGIRGSHKRAALPALRPFSIEKPLYTICSLFAICSFSGTSPGLFDPWWPVLKIAVPHFEIGLELTAVFMNNGTRISGSVLSRGGRCERHRCSARSQPCPCDRHAAGTGLHLIHSDVGHAASGHDRRCHRLCSRRRLRSVQSRPIHRRLGCLSWRPHAHHHGLADCRTFRWGVITALRTGRLLNRYVDWSRTRTPFKYWTWTSLGRAYGRAPE